MRSLMWFRRDLRVADNTALAEACRRSPDGVVGVFLLSPRQWQLHDEAPVKLDFWMRGLAELTGSLRLLNIPLLVERVDRFTGAPPALLRLARLHRCAAIHYNAEYEVNEATRDRAVEQAFRADHSDRCAAR